MRKLSLGFLAFVCLVALAVSPLASPAGGASYSSDIDFRTDDRGRSIAVAVEATYDLTGDKITGWTCAAVSPSGIYISLTCRQNVPPGEGGGSVTSSVQGSAAVATKSYPAATSSICWSATVSYATAPTSAAFPGACTTPRQVGTLPSAGEILATIDEFFYNFPYGEVGVPPIAVLPDPLPFPAEDVGAVVPTTNVLPADPGVFAVSFTADLTGSADASSRTFSCSSGALYGSAGKLEWAYNSSTRKLFWGYIPSAMMKARGGRGEFVPRIEVNHHPVNGASPRVAWWGYEHHSSFGNPLSLQGVRDNPNRTLKSGDKVLISFRKEGYSQDPDGYWMYTVVIARVTCKIP